MDIDQIKVTGKHRKSLQCALGWRAPRTVGAGFVLCRLRQTSVKQWLGNGRILRSICTLCAVDRTRDNIGIRDAMRYRWCCSKHITDLDMVIEDKGRSKQWKMKVRCERCDWKLDIWDEVQWKILLTSLVYISIILKSRSTAKIWRFSGNLLI